MVNSTVIFKKLPFCYMNGLKPSRKGLKANRFSSNQPPDFSLDVSQDINLQNLKKKKIKSHYAQSPA